MSNNPNRKMRRSMMKATDLETRTNAALERQYQQRVHKVQIQIQRAYADLIEINIPAWRLSTADWLAKYPIATLFKIIRTPRGKMRRIADRATGVDVLWKLPAYIAIALTSTIIDWLTLSPIMLVAMKCRTGGTRTFQKFLNSRQLEWKMEIKRKGKWELLLKECFEV